MYKRLISALFPRRCAICDKAIEEGKYICAECERIVRPIDGDTCRKCGKRLSDSTRLYCYDCSRKIHQYDRGFSVFDYALVKQSLYRFKYAGRAEYACYYAKAANDSLGDVLRELKADAIVPIPIHRRRLAIRGYNQAQEFAKRLSEYINVPIVNDYVKRQKATVPLKLLDEKERKNNLMGAFIIARNDVKYNTIILVDDIYTTGSTVDAVASVCRSSGCSKIYVLTIAIGRGL